MKRMNGVKLAMAFETPVDVGGAATLSAPPPTKTGMFANLARAAVAAPDKKVEAAPTPPAGQKPPEGSGPTPEAAADKTTGAPPVPTSTALKPDAAKPFQALSDDGKTLLAHFASEAELKAYVAAEVAKEGAAKTEAAVETKTETGAGTPLPRTFMGRADLKTLEDVEKLVRLSGVESANNMERARALEAALSKASVDAEAQRAALTAELEAARKTPAVPEKTEAELEALAKENPFQFHKYMQDKAAREAALQKARDGAAEAVRSRDAARQKGAAAAGQTWTAMTQDEKAYPKFNALIPRIDEIYDSLPKALQEMLDTSADSPKWLYRMAMGDVRLELEKKGVETVADAAEVARKKAASDAAALSTARGGGNDTKTDTRTAQQVSDDAWREARAKARSTNPGARIFRERTKT